MPCPHFGTCGGCDAQDVAYDVQLERKRRRLQDLLRSALGRSTPAVRPVIGMPPGDGGMPWHFRHKASFVFAPAPGQRRGFVMGHYAAGSKTVVPVEDCPVHATRANQLAFSLRDRLARAGISAAGPRLDGILRHVIVRTTHDECQAVVMLVVTRNDRSLRAPLRAFLASPGGPTGLLVNVHDRPGPFMVGEETIRIEGRAHVREDRPGAAFLVSPTAFFQTNPEAAAVLVDEVLAASAEVAQPGAPEGAVLDLYAGSGLFAVPLAARGHAVTAVEENAQAVRDGEANRRLNGIDPERLRFLRARVEDAFPRVSRSHPGLVVLDPPRQGCPPRVIDGVFVAIAPVRATYVSCNPETLARELPAVMAAGYRIARVQPVDMFPHTSHIETIVVLDREASAGRR